MPAPHAFRGALIIAGATAAIALPLLVAAPAAAATVTVTTGGVTYSADDTNIGAGASVTAYDGSVAAVVIPDHVSIGGTPYAVTRIGANAFRGSNVMTSVVIPSTVVSIGTYAFANLGQVTSIAIPDSVTSIGDWAFDSIDKLTSLTIGNGITAIGTQVFSNANHLQSVTIPISVTSIGFAAFAADDLRNVTIGSGVTTIGGSAFAYNNNLASVVVPPSVTSFGNNVFQNNSSSGVFTATFQGPAPAMGSGVFQVHSPRVVYRWRYGAPQSTGGYTSPTWQGVSSQAVATLQFDANGHGSAPAPEDVNVGSAPGAPTSPSAAGYAFAGWYTAATGGILWDFSSVVTADATLFARWTSPAVVLSSSTAAAGGTVVITGTGFAPGAALDVILHSTPVRIAGVVADPSGAFSVSVTIPASTEAGAHTIEVGAVSAALAVSDAPAALAATGVDPTTAAATAISVMLLGAALTVGRRRAARR